MKKIAVIDLGTNTFNLLIAVVEEHSFRTLFHTKIGVALGMGGINEKRITNESMERAIQALESFKLKCDEFRVDEIRAFGTSAIRDAKNKKQFCQAVKEKIDIQIQIISGLQEAQLIYNGVKWSYDFYKPAIIMDIGGGSTEFILANKNGVQNALSLNIGVSRMYQQLQLNDPLSKDDIITIENWLEQNSEGKLDNLNCKILIGSSGTFETLHEVYFKQKFPNSNECTPMSINELKEVLENIINSTLEERKQNAFIIPIRQIMIPIAAVKINWIIKKFGIEELLISPYSLKEGALNQLSQ